MVLGISFKIGFVFEVDDSFSKFVLLIGSVDDLFEFGFLSVVRECPDVEIGLVVVEAVDLEFASVVLLIWGMVFDFGEIDEFFYV